MAADGNDNHKHEPDAQKAVQAGSDFSHGSDQAYANLMAEVNAAHDKFGKDTNGFSKYEQQVVAGLTASGSMEEMAEHFAKGDLYHHATEDERKMKPEDMNPAFGKDALEKAFMTSLSNSYMSGDLQARAGKTFWGNPKDKFGDKEFDHILASRQGDRDHAEQARLAQESAVRDQQKFAGVTNALFKNDGNFQHSLYATLDGIKSDDGRTDGKISRSDLHRYEEQYARRAANGEPGFTPDNLETVRTLDHEWDKPMGLALRGTSPRGGSPRDMDRNEQVANSTINLEAAGRSLNCPPDQLYASYGPQGGRPGVTNIDGDAAMAPGARPIPGQQRFDPVTGNPIADGAPPPQNQPDVAPAPGGQPVAQGDGAPAPIQRAVGPDGRPLPLDNANPQPATRGATPGGDAYDDYYGARQPGAAPAPAAKDAPPVLHRRTPAPGDNGANPPPAPGGDGAPPAAKDAPPAAKDAPPAPAKAGALADIDHMPDLALPEVKAGDDPAKVAADFQKAAIAHFQAAAVYTVKPGQGWDRIARDTLRKSGDPAATNEGKTEEFSDAIAKMNGLSGRLDKSHVLQPNEQVRVRDDAWIQAQVDNAMKVLQQKMTDAAKPGGAAPAPDAGAQPDLYGGQRNGEGDITPAPAAKDQPPAPAAKDQPPATPAKDQPPAPAAKDQPPAPAAKDQPPAPAAVDAPPVNKDAGPVPIPKGAPPAESVQPKPPTANLDQPPPDANDDVKKKAQANNGGIPDISGSLNVDPLNS